MKYLIPCHRHKPMLLGSWEAQRLWCSLAHWLDATCPVHPAGLLLLVWAVGVRKEEEVCKTAAERRRKYVCVCIYKGIYVICSSQWQAGRPGLWFGAQLTPGSIPPFSEQSCGKVWVTCNGSWQLLEHFGQLCCSKLVYAPGEALSASVFREGSTEAGGKQWNRSALLSAPCAKDSKQEAAPESERNSFVRLCFSCFVISRWLLLPSLFA